MSEKNVGNQVLYSPEIDLFISHFGLPLFDSIEELMETDRNVSHVIKVNNLIYKMRDNDQMSTAFEKALIVDKQKRRWEFKSYATTDELYSRVVSMFPTTTTAYPELFGAAGDGITDDSEAFLKALDYLSMMSNGVLLCPNRYLIDKDVILDKPYNSQIAIIGNYLIQEKFQMLEKSLNSTDISLTFYGESSLIFKDAQIKIKAQSQNNFHFIGLVFKNADVKPDNYFRKGYAISWEYPTNLITIESSIGVGFESIVDEKLQGELQ